MSLRADAYLASGTFPEMLQGGTTQCGSLWQRKRKRSLASQLPLTSFLVGEGLSPGKLTLHTLGCSVAAWELGTTPQSVLFFPSLKVRGMCSWNRRSLREAGGRGTLRMCRMLLCGFCLVFNKLKQIF